MRKLECIIAALLFIANAFSQEFNYAEALQKSIYFYDANKCGVGSGDGPLAYRGDCHATDEHMPLDTKHTNLSAAFIEKYSSILDPDGDGTVDLTGGFHDAGDHVKFGLPQSYSTSTIEWAYYEFPEAFINIGEYEHMMNILHWGSDYYLKCTFRDDAGEIIAFCYQVGEGSIDHALWSPPELIDTSVIARPAFFATVESPASDQCAGAAASLAISYLNNKDSSATYAAECLDVAEALYRFAVNNRGTGYDGGFYNSSFDDDELSWAAIWLYIATEKEDYLTDIIKKDESGRYVGWMSKIINSVEDDWQNIWVHSWDTKWGGVFAKLAPITNDSFFWWIFRWNLEYWSGVKHEESNDGNYLMKTPGGFSWLTGWGSARYNAAAQFQGMVYKKNADDRFDEWMTDQMNYIMGDNPLGRSYIVGYSDNYAEHPHHRAAHGSSTNSMFDPVDHKHILWGALVGGPDASDGHVDSTSDYIYNEVAIDYNAGLVGALAGHVYYFGEGMKPASPFPTPDPEVTEYELKAKIEQITSERSQISIQVMNEAAFPPRRDVDIEVRYYFNISELYEYGQDISAVSFAVYYDENAVHGDAVTATGPFEFNADLGIYYMKFNWPESGFYGHREYQFGLLAKQDATYTGRWDASNDYSNENLTGDYQKTGNILMFADGVLVNGKEPSANQAPKAVFTASPSYGDLPLVVTFDASKSSDPNGDALSYSWNFGDGSSGSGVSVTHTYSTKGSYVATLVVSDGETSSSATATISAGIEVVNEAPVAVISATPLSGNVPLEVSFDASGSSDPNADALTYTWNFGDGSTASGISATHTYETAGDYLAVLTVSDGALSSTASATIQVKSITPTCDNPTSISISYTFEGAGDYCWVTSNEIGNVNSWSVESIEINGQDFTNVWSSALPAKIGGNYYIHYKASHAWSHIEIFSPEEMKSATGSTTKAEKAKIYPNPFNNQFTVNFGGEEYVESIEIYDMKGVLSSKHQISAAINSINIGEELTPGFYYVKINTAKDAYAISIIKQ